MQFRSVSIVLLQILLSLEYLYGQQLGLLGFSLREQVLLDFLNEAKQIGDQVFANKTVNDIDISPEFKLYNITCSIVNSNYTEFLLVLYNMTNDATLIAYNSSLECIGLYSIAAGIIPAVIQNQTNDTNQNKTEANNSTEGASSTNTTNNQTNQAQTDSKWLLNIQNFTVTINISVGANETEYQTWLPIFVLQNTSTLIINQTLFIQGLSGNQTQTVELPVSNDTKALIENAVNTYLNESLGNLSQRANNEIMANLSKLSLSNDISYLPSFNNTNPLILDPFINLFLLGKIYLAQLGINETYNYDLMTMTFDDFQSVADQDLQILISPQFVQDFLLSYILSVNYLTTVDLNNLIQSDQLNAEKLTIQINDYQQLKVTQESNDTMKISINDYNLNLSGTIKTSSDDDSKPFSLECNVRRDPSEIRIQFYNITNNYSMQMPQVTVLNISPNINDDRCDLHLEGGLFTEIEEAYIENFRLDNYIEQIENRLNSQFSPELSQKINNYIREQWVPIEVLNDTLILNYTLIKPVNVRSDAFSELNIDIIPEVIQGITNP
ncbi:UNKNOWN [Stylonychia lemnae]|uniref:Uncharacterized protein n=1 Tax=Stylonychia lemnae TaxID=5949 RepID=A0A078BA24_STYLE|nr:UNKNOWN [Stylonychia lemnae]|eukprot:CDW91091.1 UNKNOWN [Stylonychia lemnae]